MNEKDALNMRLYNQHIYRQTCKNVAELSTYLAAIQGQDYEGAKWSLALRLPGTTEKEIEDAISARQVVRTWPMRGTLHLVSAADVNWMLNLCTPRILAGSAGRHAGLELDEIIFSRSRDLIEKALAGGQRLTRKALMALLESNGITTGGQRGYHILWWLAQKGVICMGPQEGKQQTFVLLTEWVRNARNLSREEALVELAKRYFISRGPATLADFVWWSGLKISEARAALQGAAGELQKDKLNEQDCWFAPQIARLSMPALRADLLPGFDEYMLAYTDRSLALNPLFAQRVCPGNSGMFSSTLLCKGKVRGSGHRVT